MTSEASASRKIEWGPLIVVTIGALIFLLGAVRFFLRQHFGLIDAMNCALTIIAAGFILLVSDYVVHHARLVTVIPLFVIVVFVISSPVFDIAFGLALVGAIVVPAVGEWHEGKRRLTEAGRS